MSIENWTLEKKLCRCCHAEGDYFKNLAEPCFDSGYEEIYANMIKDCFFINVVPVPGVLSAATYSICEPCITSLQDASKFRKKVAECEAKFLELYSKNAIKIEVPALDIAVKEEPSDSCPEDDFLLADDSSDELPGEIDDDGLCDDERFVFEKNTKETVKKKPKKAPAKTTKAKKGKTKKIKEEPQTEGAEGPEVEKEKIEKKKKARTKRLISVTVSGEELTEKYPILKNHLGRGTYYTIIQNRYSCNDCHRSFASQPLVSQHYRFVHLKKRPRERKCPKCDEMIPGYLRAYHLENKHGIPAPTCGVCGKKFRFPCHVLEHQKKVHMGEKTVVCGICEKSFFNQLSLRLHMSSHSNEKRFKCEACGRRFRWENNLKDHMKIHTGDKRFVCRVCDKAFVQKSTLKQHTARNHAGVQVS